LAGIVIEMFKGVATDGTVPLWYSDSPHWQGLLRSRWSMAMVEALGLDQLMKGEEGAMKGFMDRFISRLTLSMLVGVALPFVFSTAMIAKDVPVKTAPEIGFIELGYISRIDAKNHAVMIQEAKSGGDDGWPTYKQCTGDIGARRGRRGRWVGLITPGGVGDPTGSRRPYKTSERKVVLSPETVLKDGEATISFEELEVGDFVQIKSVMHGKNFEAKEVQRYSKKGIAL